MLKPRILGAIALAGVVAACADEPAYYDNQPPAYASHSAYYPPPGAAYGDSARVVAIDEVRGPGRSSGAGAVMGGIAGGVLGHQFGSGRGNTAATAAGAIGGAVAGNEIEKRHGGDSYRITVRFPDGREADFTQNHLDGLRVGDRVHVEGNRVEPD